MYSLLSSSLPPSSHSLCSADVAKRLRLRWLRPLCSSTKKQEQRQQNTLQKPPQSLRRLLNWSPNPNPKPESDDGDDDPNSKGLDMEGDTAVKGTLLAGLLLVSVVGGFGAVGYVYTEQINSFLTQFSTYIEVGWGCFQGVGPM